MKLHLGNRFLDQIQKKVLKLPELLQELDRQKKTKATLNGAFDLLHLGHHFMIQEAKKQAELLILLCNSDAAIKKSKGINRPFYPLQTRMLNLACLTEVDYVCSFDEPDPRKILSFIQPQVHVNGEEYTHNCIEKEVVEKAGGTIYLLPRIPHFSTTALIQIIGEKNEKNSNHK